MKRPAIAAVAAIAAAGLALLGAAPAQAATDTLYLLTEGTGGFNYFTVLDPATPGVGAQLSFPTNDGIGDAFDHPRGMDVVDGTGYQVFGYGDGETIVYLSTWDLADGSIDYSIGLTTSEGQAFFGADEPVPFDTVEGLDAPSSDQILTVAYFEDAEGKEYVAVAEADPVSGHLTPLVDLTPLKLSGFSFRGIATDPSTGTTYVLGAVGGQPGAAPVDLGGGTYGTPFVVTAYDTESVPGFADGDFDASGTFYAPTYEVDHLIELSAPFGGGSAVIDHGAIANFASPPGGTPSLATTDGGTPPTDPTSSPTDDPTAPATTATSGGGHLAATGINAGPVALAGIGLLLLGGIALAVAGRRRWGPGGKAA